MKLLPLVCLNFPFKALDRLLENMRACQFPFETVAAISGSGQQHGSVYWKNGSEELLKSLDPSQTLVPQLQVITIYQFHYTPINLFIDSFVLVPFIRMLLVFPILQYGWTPAQQSSAIN